MAPLLISVLFALPPEDPPLILAGVETGGFAAADAEVFLREIGFETEAGQHWIRGAIRSLEAWSTDPRRPLRRGSLVIMSSTRPRLDTVEYVEVPADAEQQVKKKLADTEDRDEGVFEIKRVSESFWIRSFLPKEPTTVELANGKNEIQWRPSSRPLYSHAYRLHGGFLYWSRMPALQHARLPENHIQNDRPGALVWIDAASAPQSHRTAIYSLIERQALPARQRADTDSDLSWIIRLASSMTQLSLANDLLINDAKVRGKLQLRSEPTRLHGELALIGPRSSTNAWLARHTIARPRVREIAHPNAAISGWCGVRITDKTRDSLAPVLRQITSPRLLQTMLASETIEFGFRSVETPGGHPALLGVVAVDDPTSCLSRIKETFAVPKSTALKENNGLLWGLYCPAADPASLETALDAVIPELDRPEEKPEPSIAAIQINFEDRRSFGRTIDLLPMNAAFKQAIHDALLVQAHSEERPESDSLCSLKLSPTTASRTVLSLRCGEDAARTSSAILLHLFDALRAGPSSNR